tara:strand:+ start:1198 stop:1353 length:156 start_codon:yes stop_codon:yes gene_type:complete
MELKKLAKAVFGEIKKAVLMDNLKFVEKQNKSKKRKVKPRKNTKKGVVSEN